MRQLSGSQEASVVGSWLEVVAGGVVVKLFTSGRLGVVLGLPELGV